MTVLQEVFFQYFDVITGNDPDLVDDACKLRYQVYCVEHDFENASEFPDGRETDSYEPRSVHGIVRHLQTGVTAATVRLVLPDPHDPDLPFPIEQHCSRSLKSSARILGGVPRDTIAEISRFAVSRDFKRRAGEAETVVGVGPDPDSYLKRDLQSRRVIPHLIVGLFAAIVKMSAEHNIHYWYAVMDVSLLRLLGRFGINFQRLGAPVDYHGLRQPCFGAVDDVLNGIWLKQRDIWKLITADGFLWPAPECGKRKASQ